MTDDATARLRALEDATARLHALEDREAIRELRATYCFLVDDGRGDELTDNCFTDDAHCDFRATIPGSGLEPILATGHEEVQRFFTIMVPALLRDMRHTVHNHRIRLDGDRASGDCYFELTAIDAGTGEPVIGSGRYIDEYRRVEGAWRFSVRRAEIDFIAPLARGWAAQRFPGAQPE